jgi:hypothetical protein
LYPTTTPPSATCPVITTWTAKPPNDDQSLLLSQIFLYPINVGIVHNFGGMIEQIP